MDGALRGETFDDPVGWLEMGDVIQSYEVVHSIGEPRWYFRFVSIGEFVIAEIFDVGFENALYRSDVAGNAKWRRGRDSNPRSREAHLISSQAG